MKKNTLFLINPKANEGRSLVHWERATNRSKQFGNPYDITKIGSIKKLILQKKPDILAVIGGDGTINSVCESILQIPKKNRPIIAIIPCGFGNALSYCLGVETIQKALVLLQNPKDVVSIDILQTNFADRPIGLFNISVGFDASIVHGRMNDRYIGFRSYVLSAVKSIVTHPKKMLTITVDGVFTFKVIASSLVVANCPVIGQNFVVAPDARLNDGLLDCTLFSTKFAYLTNLRFKGFKHPLYSAGGKVFFKAKSIQIDGDPFVQIDGDPFVRQEGVRIEILPKALTFLHSSLDTTPREYQSFIV